MTASHLCFYSSSTLELLQSVLSSFLSPDKASSESLQLVIPISIIHSINAKTGGNDIAIIDTGWALRFSLFLSPSLLFLSYYYFFMFTYSIVCTYVCVYICILIVCCFYLSLYLFTDLSFYLTSSIFLYIYLSDLCLRWQ